MNHLTSREELIRQNERLRLLLSLTNQITSNLDLREVVRSISANIREELLGDLVCVALADTEQGRIRIYALDYPGSPGIVTEGMLVALTPAGRSLFENLRPVIASTNAPSEFPVELKDQIAFAQEPKMVCFVPLVNRGRALGLLAIGRTARRPYGSDDLEFLSQVGAQIAIAIDNALAYRKSRNCETNLRRKRDTSRNRFEARWALNRL